MKPTIKKRILGMVTAALVGASTLALAPLSATAAPGSDTPHQVSEATLSWGVKDSFRSYVNGGIAKGKITPVGDVEIDDNIAAPGSAIHWSQGTGKLAATHDSGLISFAGGVNFWGHEGILDTTISNPEIKFTSHTSAVLITDVKGFTFKSFHEKGEPFNTPDIEFAEIQFTAPPKINGSTITLDSADLKLTKAGNDALGAVYGAGKTLEGTFKLSFKATAPTDTDKPKPTPESPVKSLFEVIKSKEPVSFNFVDIDRNLFTSEIQWIADRGVTTGWDVGNGRREFRPLARIERQAMAAFMYRAAGSPVVDTSACEVFADVPRGHEFFTEICWMRSEGITTGYREDNTFRPNESVTREAMAAFIYRMVGEPEFTPVGGEFRDLAASQEFQKEIAWMAGAGVSTGWDVAAGKEYRPKEFVNRDAMAAFMYRLIHKF